MRRFSTRELTFAAVLAAVYAALTVALPIPQFGPVQCRLAEALTVLPFFFPGATPGLVVDASSPICSPPIPWTSCAAPPPPCWPV